MGRTQQNRKAALDSKPASWKATLREENTGKKPVNMASLLKMEHMQKLAMWASGEGSVPCLAALYGKRLADISEVAGVPLDRSLFVCHRCETILQPGDNCTIRIEKNTKKLKRSHVPMQNNVVYTCNFCSHRNVLVGTTKGHVKELLNSTGRRAFNAKEETSTKMTIDNEGKEDLSFGQKLVSELRCNSPFTPNIVLEKKRKMNDGSVICKEANSGQSSTTTDAAKGKSGSSKRRRKGWTNLKEIAESTERANKTSISNLVIPFKL